MNLAKQNLLMSSFLQMLTLAVQAHKHICLFILYPSLKSCFDWRYGFHTLFLVSAECGTMNSFPIWDHIWDLYHFGLDQRVDNWYVNFSVEFLLKSVCVCVLRLTRAQGLGMGMNGWIELLDPIFVGTATLLLLFSNKRGMIWCCWKLFRGPLSFWLFLWLGGLLDSIIILYWVLSCIKLAILSNCV